MLNIRRATLNDVDTLCYLSGEIQENHLAARPDYFKPHEVTQLMVTEFESLVADEKGYLYIGEVDGKGVGYIACEVVVRPENSYMYEVRYLYIDQMGVDRAYRSSGYGEQLMRHTFELAKSLGLTKVILNVWAFNERAIAFYQRQGFKVRDLRMEAHVE